MPQRMLGVIYFDGTQLQIPVTSVVAGQWGKLIGLLGICPECLSSGVIYTSEHNLFPEFGNILSEIFFLAFYSPLGCSKLSFCSSGQWVLCRNFGTHLYTQSYPQAKNLFKRNLLWVSPLF